MPGIDEAVEHSTDERIAAAIARIEAEDDEWQRQIEARLTSVESNSQAEAIAALRSEHELRLTELRAELEELKNRPPQKVVVTENIEPPPEPEPNNEPPPPTTSPSAPEKSPEEESLQVPAQEITVEPEKAKPSAEAPDALPAPKRKLRLI
jgi:hypothetical protein